ncbi:MAG: twin-arginine translocation signal domain-containing protein [Deltaproteobacteria bacterium]|nr:MAG: twin-arginine translocation signal domain-containing protein [Deltaproteobacteria bacterium]
MNRRDFLKYSAAATLASTMPLGAFAESYVPGMEVLTPAFDRARERGKALLCLLVPEDPAERWKRGGAFGDMLLISDDSTMAELSQVDVVCVGERVVRSYTDWLEWNEGCLMALIETAEGEPSQPCSTASLPSPLIPHDFEGGQIPSGHTYAEVRARRMGALVHQTIARNDDMTKRRATQCIQAVGKGLAQSVIHAVEKGKSVPPERVDKVAPILAWHAVTASDEVRERITRLLANAGRTRMVHNAPSGSKWIIPATEGAEAKPGPSGAVPYLSFDVAPKAEDDKGKKSKKG